MEALAYIQRGADPEDRKRSIVAPLPLPGSALETWLDLQATACEIAF
jgi:hypothetical protein